jgi:hypothetical protein
MLLLFILLDEGELEPADVCLLDSHFILALVIWQSTVFTPDGESGQGVTQ